VEVLPAQEKFAEAEMLGTKALADFENMDRSGDIDVISIEFAMGRIYHRQGRLLDAVSMLERALRGYTDVYGIYGPQHPVTKVVFSEYMSVVQKIQ
jgi:hypothetical protein